MGNQNTTQKDWERINKFLNKFYTGDAQHEVELGRLFKEYVEESIHSGWEGFSSNDRTGIRRFLLDLITYKENL